MVTRMVHIIVYLYAVGRRGCAEGGVRGMDRDFMKDREAWAGGLCAKEGQGLLGGDYGSSLKIGKTKR